MAQAGVQLKTVSCSICLDLLKEPVTIPCGHSYCLSCIKNHWDEEDAKNIHSCPQCRQTFAPRPVLMKNTTLADLVEELKITGLEPTVADHCYAGAEDVACDVCSGRKLKAVKSCLVCLASYCDKHLQPHYESDAFKKHKLVDPSEKLQENICSHHDEVMKMFCRTDQQCICYLCSVDEHKGHDTVSSAGERTERQKGLEVSRQKIQQIIKDKLKVVKVYQQEVEAISRSADEAAEKTDKILTMMIQRMGERKRDVKQQIRFQKETEINRVKEMQSKLEQEITELRRKDAEMDKLSRTDDDNQFLVKYPSVSRVSEDQSSHDILVLPLSYFDHVPTAATVLRDKLQHSLTDEWTNISLTITQPKVLLQPEPRTRAGFLQYSHKITVDPDTVDKEKNTTTLMSLLLFSPKTFGDLYQVLSRESLPGRCYWEVERSGADVYIAVAYKDIQVTGFSAEHRFGHNDKSWALICDEGSPVFQHDGVKSPVPGPVSSRIGVYLDHTAGILSFYNSSETMTLIHRVQTTFTQPLYAGLSFWKTRGTAHFPNLQ